MTTQDVKSHSVCHLGSHGFIDTPDFEGIIHVRFSLVRSAALVGFSRSPLGIDRHRTPSNLNQSHKCLMHPQPPQHRFLAKGLDRMQSVEHQKIRSPTRHQVSSLLLIQIPPLGGRQAPVHTIQSNMVLGKLLAAGAAYVAYQAAKTVNNDNEASSRARQSSSSDFVLPGSMRGSKTNAEKKNLVYTSELKSGQIRLLADSTPNST
jgi:hypothetical protein